jgi:hypothetical protein
VRTFGVSDRPYLFFVFGNEAEKTFFVDQDMRWENLPPVLPPDEPPEEPPEEPPFAPLPPDEPPDEPPLPPPPFLLTNAGASGMVNALTLTMATTKR